MTLVDNPLVFQQFKQLERKNYEFCATYSMTVHFLSFLKQTLQSERPKATHPFPGRLRTLDLLPRIARNGYSALLLVGLLECKAWKPRHLEVEPKVNDLEISYVYVIGGSIL